MVRDRGLGLRRLQSSIPNVRLVFPGNRSSLGFRSQECESGPLDCHQDISRKLTGEFPRLLESTYIRTQYQRTHP